MPDIFISYSRQDSAQAEQLAELLSSAGLSCWIDRQGIDLATSWSKEIVQAIDGCRAFVVLLSAASTQSINVQKEVSLAAEQKKKILPLDIEPVALSEELRYHLAGIQRTSMTNIDAIIRALSKLGLEATSAPTMTLVHESSTRKSLMILPFEDLSPTGDNQWFADGLVSEMIASLSHIKSLRVIDQQTTRDYKNYKGPLATYACEMRIRYFVQGFVRKFGDQIKISAALLDLETGDHLWQENHRGVMDDIFEIQEMVAKKVVSALQSHIGASLDVKDEEIRSLTKHGTDNAEAYEFYLKGCDYYTRYNKPGIQHAAELFDEAIKLDPNFAEALRFKGVALAEIFRRYDPQPEYLSEAESLITRAHRLRPDSGVICGSLSLIYLIQGKMDEAEQIAIEGIRKEPEECRTHNALGFLYAQQDKFELAIEPFKNAARFDTDSAESYYNLAVVQAKVGPPDKTRKVAEEGLALHERQLRLAPDDDNTRSHYATLLQLSGRDEECKEVLRSFDSRTDLDGQLLFNIGLTQLELKDYEGAAHSLRKSWDTGFERSREFWDDPELEPIRGMPEIQEILQQLEREKG
jgi:adenylate cyclase